MQYLDSIELRRPTCPERFQFIEEANILMAKLVIIDEISRFGPCHLARLDSLCKSSRRNYHLDFGSNALLLCGDAGQLGPAK
jgi:hypothetical protein